MELGFASRPHQIDDSHQLISGIALLKDLHDYAVGIDVVEEDMKVLLLISISDSSNC